MTSFRALLEDEASLLCQAVKAARRGATTCCVICELQPPLIGFTGELQAVFNSDLTPLLDAFASFNRLRPLGSAWVEVDKETARWVLVRCLSRGLAHDVEVMTKGEAAWLAHEFTTICIRGSETERIRFFTNGKAVDGPTMVDVRFRRLQGWMPATEATFDTGVVMVTRRRIGLVWVEDED